MLISAYGRQGSNKIADVFKSNLTQIVSFMAQNDSICGAGWLQLCSTNL